MVKIFDTESGTQIGTISEDELRFLIDQLEEEDLEDKDYYINRATLDMFEARGADPDLLSTLRQAMGNRRGYGHSLVAAIIAPMAQVCGVGIPFGVSACIT